MLENQPINHSAIVPLFYWRGARPFPLTLTADDTGTADLLLLSREDDLCLMPISWDQNLPAPYAPLPVSFHADALDREAVRLTLHDLKSDGWQVNGRLHLTFTGQETELNFTQNTEAALWRATSSE